MLVAAIVACLLLCGAGGWMARNTLVAPFILPGATDLVVAGRGLNGLTLTYRAAGPPHAWSAALAKRLGTDGWRAREYTFTGTRAPFIVTSYSYEVTFGPFRLIEHAVVGGDPDDPNLVHVQAHRQFRFRR
jgi:hypothetical protein